MYDDPGRRNGPCGEYTPLVEHLDAVLRNLDRRNRMSEYKLQRRFGTLYQEVRSRDVLSQLLDKAKRGEKIIVLVS